MELLETLSEKETTFALDCIRVTLGFIDTPLCQEIIDSCSRKLSGHIEDHPREIHKAINPLYDFYPDYFEVAGFVVYLRAGPRVFTDGNIISYPRLLVRLRYE